MKTDSTYFMNEALTQAKKAALLGEVPVGAVLVSEGEIIARAHNLVETGKDATAHAEVLAIRYASEALDKWRLSECDLYVTLEPCPMCAGAILLSRVSKVYYGAKDPRIGALGSAFDLSNIGGMPHRFEAIGGLLGRECAKLLTDFFTKQRK